jgi:mRNA interferase MazF
MPNVTILPLTSTPRRLYPSEVILTEGKAGPPLKSIIMTHQIRTISKQRLGKLMGYLDDHDLRHEIHRAIKEHLDIE